ncbi:MAG TPA: ribonuclease HII [Patescibacteria group bacterium]|nr:ribonuclease HII [Patescibacteria group bacterium]
MNIQGMTVSEIRLLLEHNSLGAELAAGLQNDQRQSVQKLFDVWKRRQQHEQMDRERVARLYQYEREITTRGCRRIAGVDEAGRGPLAGPVQVAAVILPGECYIPELNDSKKMTETQRERAYEVIRKQALAIASVAVPVERIDEINIYQATLQGMYQALQELNDGFEAVLVDAMPLPELTVPWHALIGGDRLSASIAAASVIAKVERDRLMAQYDRQYPGYGFGRHKGYGTSEHLMAIQDQGPCPIHRRSFAPVKEYLDLQYKGVEE